MTILIVDPPNNHDGRHGLEYDDPRYLHHEHTDGAVSECPPPTSWLGQSRSCSSEMSFPLEKRRVSPEDLVESV